MMLEILFLHRTVHIVILDIMMFDIFFLAQQVNRNVVLEQIFNVYSVCLLKGIIKEDGQYSCSKFGPTLQKIKLSQTFPD